MSEAVWPSMLPRLLSEDKCPLCTSIRFEEAEAGPMDRVMRFFRMAPVRCENCYRRYYRYTGKQHPSSQTL